MNTDTHTQHTPGPWHTEGLAVYAANSYNEEFCGRLRDFSNPIAQVCGDPMSADAEIEQCLRADGTAGPRWRNPGAGEAEANARLIAAAPELLAALRECAKQLSAIGAKGHASVARAAIAKAEGRA